MPIFRISNKMVQKIKPTNFLGGDKEKQLQKLIIYPQAKQYWFDVKLPKQEVKKQFTNLDVRPHKDEVFTHIRCSENTKIDDLAILAKQAYEITQ